MKIEEIRNSWRQLVAQKELKQVSELLRQSPERDKLMQRGRELCAHTFVFDHPSMGYGAVPDAAHHGNDGLESGVQ